ncbi:uncharacterized protein LOC119109321 [Pollicipes pollicipes]|uniref:uncharacterized protein LOC119109321 n=1 Tax=Pollicipes pollicipes TaxID=41117 RepID=UPI0018858732|nr:uncharacterized protein LOC119109321 [Pollicipes pollicipes]
MWLETVAADKLQAQLKQLNATLQAKEAQIRALTGGERRPTTPDHRPTTPDHRQTSSDRQQTTPEHRDPDSPPAGQGAGCRSRSPPSDPFQRRRRQACTERDLRLLRDSDDIRSLLRCRRCLGRPSEPASEPAAARADRLDACDLADPDGELEPTQPGAGGQTAAREEIQRLRECRDSLHNQRRRINAKLHQGRQLDAAEARRLLELDEALHAVDEVLEHKAGRLAGGAPPPDARRLLLNQRDLMPRLLGLATAELRLLYCRTFQRLVDQRVDGLDKDVVVAGLDAQVDDQLRGMKRLERMVQDLMRERSHYKKQRDELRRRLCCCRA